MDNTVRNNTKQYAMYFGAYLGVYMILKFILLPLAFIIPFLSFLFLALTLGVPFIAYYYLKLYRNKVCGGYISFGRAYFFSIQIYFYAALVVAIAHFVYFQFIDQGFIIEHLQAQVDLLLERSEDLPDINLIRDNLQFSIDNFSSLSATDITFNNISFNIFFSLFISIPTALIVKRQQPQDYKK